MTQLRTHFTTSSLLLACWMLLCTTKADPLPTEGEHASPELSFQSMFEMQEEELSRLMDSIDREDNLQNMFHTTSTSTTTTTTSPTTTDQRLLQAEDIAQLGLSMAPAMIAQYLAASGDFQGFATALKDLLTSHLITPEEAIRYRDDVGRDYNEIMESLQAARKSYQKDIESIFDEIKQQSLVAEETDLGKLMQQHIQDYISSEVIPQIFTTMDQEDPQGQDTAKNMLHVSQEEETKYEVLTDGPLSIVEWQPSMAPAHEEHNQEPLSPQTEEKKPVNIQELVQPMDATGPSRVASAPNAMSTDYIGDLLSGKFQAYKKRTIKAIVGKQYKDGVGRR